MYKLGILFLKTGKFLQSWLSCIRWRLLKKKIRKIKENKCFLLKNIIQDEILVSIKQILIKLSRDKIFENSKGCRFSQLQLSRSSFWLKLNLLRFTIETTLANCLLIISTSKLDISHSSSNKWFGNNFFFVYFWIWPTEIVWVSLWATLGACLGVYLYMSESSTTIFFLHLNWQSFSWKF